MRLNRSQLGAGTASLVMSIVLVLPGLMPPPLWYFPAGPGDDTIPKYEREFLLRALGRALIPLAAGAVAIYLFRDRGGPRPSG